MHSLQKSVLLSSLVLATPITAGRIPHRAVCGQAGYGGDTDAYFYDDENTLNTLLKCQKHCYNDLQCKSISFSKHTCMHYTVEVAGNFDADSDSPFIFYDRTCYTPSSPVSAGLQIPTKATTTANVINTSTTATVPHTSATSSFKDDRKAKQAESSSPNSAHSTSSERTIANPTYQYTSKTGSTTSTANTPSLGSSSSFTDTPVGCDIPTSYVVSSFYMFNATHNLDCVKGPDIGDGTGCLEDGKWCDPKLDTNCTKCGIDVCSPGLPPQPIGYGPLDNVKIAFKSGTYCQQGNPGPVRDHEIGQGRLQCNRAGPSVYFYGSSDSAVNTGHVHVNGKNFRCNDGRIITGYYDGYFDYPCIRDTQGNATCTYDKQINVPLTGFSIS